MHKKTTIIYRTSFIAICLSLLTFVSVEVKAQSFEGGLSLYEEAQYTKAVVIFNRLNSPEAKLFSGKSYFSMGKYVRAKDYLNSVPQNAPKDIYLEALYTSSLSDFQLGHFDQALTKLLQFENEQVKTQLVTDALQLYDEILNFLTLNQRKDVYQSVTSKRLKFDLVKTALGKVNYSTARLLINEYKETVAEDSLSSEVQELQSMVSDSLNYAMQIAFGRQLEAPEGITYNIGAALPEYDTGDREFDISQGLYFGYLLAAEEYNQHHNDKKAFIRYKNTGAETDSSEYVMTDFAWNYNVDAVLGPLFSEPAGEMSRLAEMYQIPMLAPLANSDTLNVDNPYLFQANPTFASHGKKMARFAVNRLNMDTLAVLAERNSLGEASAFAFREEAEKNGGKVVHFFVEDLESEGYEVAEYTKYLTADSLKIDSLGNYHNVDAVYAPFTGQAAPTLIDLLLIDLEATDSPVTVLGSQEWGATPIPEDRLGDRRIYFSESYYINSKSDKVDQFRQNFSGRFGIEANRFAMIGYDAATYLLQTLDRVKNPDLLKNALSRQPLYEGLISNIRFDGTHVNQEVKIFRLSADNGIQPAN
ncbi:ABC transporter substrate-binding protein [Balneolaceae bacterium YR4-1]|uniref:ABC transporter substrate-binding protein n=1 Tax=Halalkalibaculum roseum TaxID=2709311 RepID=A0A6M1T377_9BACT|nr:ABC transporter substrate-binding protein [Halalkalibaculum roseum]NGP76455.1 ABC transporter substrate-binding protein [Halalkalibaculum roseum]